MSTQLILNPLTSKGTSKKSTQWTEKRIGDVCIVGNGTHAKMKRVSEGVMYLTAKNFKEDGLNLSRIDYISEADFNRYFRDNSQALTKPSGGDVVLSIIGTIGRAYLVKPHERFGLSSSVAILRPNREILWPKYLYYWVKGPTFQNALRGIVGGVVQAYVSLLGLKALPIRYPSLVNQRKIAAILSAYDELIANNQKRIQILENMTRSIYREWFVRFRFPGWENIKLVDSPVGMIPEGWEVKRIEEVLETVTGDTPSTRKPEFWENGDITWFTPSDLTAAGAMFVTDSPRKITQLGLKKTKARIFPPYSVMMTSRATIGVVAINTRPACTNQGFITCIPTERLSAFYLYYWLEENIEKISSLSSGAMFKEVYQSNFRQLPIAIPDAKIHSLYVEYVKPFCKQIEILLAQNEHLRKSRDLLLSKLISEEIDVENLEVDLDEEEN